MPAPGFYDGLNETDPPHIPLTMRALAELIEKMNYGQHRLITELIRVREASWKHIEYESYRKETQMLRDLLEKGFY